MDPTAGCIAEERRWEVREWCGRAVVKGGDDDINALAPELAHLLDDEGLGQLDPAIKHVADGHP
jgi:hypothetical protein